MGITRVHMGSKDQTQTLMRADRDVSPSLFILSTKKWEEVGRGGKEESRDEAVIPLSLEAAAEEA